MCATAALDLISVAYLATVAWAKSLRRQTVLV
jgi:hypothetical protein